MKYYNTSDGQIDIIHAMLTDRKVRKKCEKMMKKEILDKYTFPTKKSSDNYYHINLIDKTKKSGRTQLKSKTLKELKEKVIQYELGIQGQARKTFANVFDILQSEKERYINNAEKLLSVHNTISRNKSEYKRFFGDTAFAKMHIDEITSKDIEDIIYCNIVKYNLRPKGIASLKALLNQSFDFAFKQEWINENPFLRVDFTKFRYMAADCVPIEQRKHSDDDLKKFLDFLHNKQKKQPDYLPSYALELQILTGLRRGEIPPLQWSDVTEDFIAIHQEQITVKKHGNIPEHFEIVNHTKTYKSRKYPMSDDLKDLIERLKAVHNKYYPTNNYLFPAKSENGVITNNTVYNLYRRMIKKLGYKQEQGVILGTHSFRRNAITRTVNASNGNLVLAAELFGNSPEVIKSNYYTGIDMDNAKAVVNTVRLL